VPSHEVAQESIATPAELYKAPYENLGNPDLPIFSRKQEIIDALQENQVLLVISPTGTGKSTQIPQYALEAGFEVTRMTQPRRRAALNVANRVQEELGLVLGEEPAEELVGCHTGAGLTGPYDAPTQIKTEGVLRIQNAFQPTSGDNELWILDEAHEASNEMWMLSRIAKQKLAENPNFTVVVMTATPDKYETIDYWTSAEGIEPAVIELEGGTNFEIEYREEPESTTAREGVKAAIDIFNNPEAHDGSNTVQIFEAGKREIKNTVDEILRNLPAEVRAKSVVLQNHAKMTPEAQQPVYEDFEGIKIVVQTNIGKTSLTIPRTRYVITSGEERMIILDEEDGTPGLEKVPSSIDDIIQEIGRGGRTSTSIGVLTRHDGSEFMPLSERPQHPIPEILRSNVDNVVMGIAGYGENIRDFSANSKPPIPRATLDRAIQRLQTLGALDENEELTNLGRRMSKYPASPEHQRSLVEAERHGVQVRLAMAAMVASAEVGGLRLFDSGSAAWEQFTDEASSDLFAQLETFIKIKRRRVNESARQDLDINNVIRADEIYRKIAHRSGIEDIPHLEVPSVRERATLKECIIRGYAHSAFLPAGDELFKAIGGAARLRAISNRSVVPKSTRHAVVGTPFDIQIEQKGVLERVPILESVTEVTVAELGKFAVNLTRWQHIGYAIRGGNRGTGGTMVAVEEQVLGRRVIGRREVPAEPSPILRAAVIEHVKSRPGEHLKTLYKIKSELERLDRRSKSPISRLSQDAVDLLIERAAPDDVDSPGHVEDNLRKIIADEKISLGRYITPVQRAQIMHDAPDTLEVDGFLLKMMYLDRKPIVRKASEDVILGLQQQPMLPDGREVWFMYDDKKYSLDQVRQRIIGTSER
jgi:HrpA-like RNA helicase